jgi:phosphodiesterase/alkaline phosphatase D-like protein
MQRTIFVCLLLAASFCRAIAGDLKVTWEPNTEPDLAGYFVYYGPKSKPQANRINVGRQTEYLIKNLTVGETYYISVTAADEAGNESLSSELVSARVVGDLGVTLEAENMPIKTTGGARPPGWGLWSNGYLAQTVNFPRTESYRFTLRAYGSIAALAGQPGEWSKAELRIDQVARAVITVNTPTYAEFTTTFSVTAGTHQVAIAFINDLYNPPEDRNLWVDWLKIQAVGGDTQPPVISNVNASNITTSAATITWNTNEASDSQVEYGLTASYGLSSPLDTAMVNSHSVTLSNLQPNTTYHYRVKSKDAALAGQAGNLAVSDNFTFTTMPAFELTLEAENMPIKTTGSARPPGWGMWNNGQLAQTVNFPRTDSYRFILRAYGSIAALAGQPEEWSKAELRIDQVARAVITVNTPTYAEFTATFSVTAGTHQVAIAFINDLYNPPQDRNLWVDWLKIQAVGGDTQPPVISHVAAGNITTSAATITWHTDKASDSQVEYGLTASYGLSSPLDTAMVNSHSVTLSNLQPNTTYHYRVKSKDAALAGQAGNLAVSDNFTFTTMPAFELTLEAENMPIKTTGSARPPGWGMWNNGQLAQTVNFPRTDSYRFILRAYGSIAALAGQPEEWSKAELRIDQVARAVITVNTPTYAEFTATFSVTAGTHQVAIAFINDLYNPPQDRNLWVDWLKIQAAPPNTEPLVISNVNASNITGSTATITWTTNKPSDSQVEYGLTANYGSSSPLDTAMVNSHSVTLSNLQPNTTYYYRVKSKDAALAGQAGNLATSDVQTFQTSAPATPVGVLAFTDITLAAGAGGPAHADSTGGHAAGFADVDNDGQPDLYISMYNVPENPTNDLFFRNINGRVFADEAVQRGIADYDGGSHGVAFADLDNDGDYDLYNGTTRGATGVLGINNIYRNNGNGFFVDVSGSSGIPIREWETRAAIAFDMDGDGDLDLFCVNDYLGTDDAPEDRNEVYRNDGNLRFTAINDGALFLARAGQGATDTDFDGDGDIDVIAANRSGEVNLLRNDGNGNFTQISPASLGITHRAGDGITMADIDNDGDLDMLLASDNEGYLYRNNGAGFSLAQRFTETDGYMGAFADLDNDGDVDLVFAGDDVCYLNNGSGVFSAGPSIPVAGINDPRGIGFADIDNDGDVDFAVGAKRSRNWLIRNDFNAGNWLKVRLISPQGQAGAFGAKTRIYPANQAGLTGQVGALAGMRESRSNNGYLGQDDPVLHFGLGQLTAVDVVTTFLDGITITQRNVAAGQTITIDGRTGDLEAPVISQVAAANITSSSAVVSWTTNERSDSQVEYGLNANYGQVTTLDPARVNSHVVMLSGLQANTTYHYRVKSKDAAGNLATSNNFTFTTGITSTLFADDFSSGALDANKWNKGTNAGNQSLVASSRLELRSQGAESGWVITRNAYAAKNTVVSVKVVQPNSDGDLGISPTFNLASKFGLYDEPNWYRFYTYRNGNSGPYRLFVQWKKNGAEGGLDVTGSLLINGAVYLRLRFDNTHIHFEASLDSLTWTNTYGEPFGLPGYTLDSRFYYELAGYNTGTYGVLAVDDFAIIQTGSSSVLWGGVTRPNAPAEARRDDAPIPTAFALQNYPNPFNAATRIRFALPHDSEIQLTVFDLGGRLVHELFNGSRSAGNHEMIWDGRNREGNELSTGIYLVRLRYRAEKSGAWSQLVQRVTMAK